MLPLQVTVLRTSLGKEAAASGHKQTSSKAEEGLCTLTLTVEIQGSSECRACDLVTKLAAKLADGALSEFRHLRLATSIELCPPRDEISVAPVAVQETSSTSPAQPPQSNTPPLTTASVTISPTQQAGGPAVSSQLPPAPNKAWRSAAGSGTQQGSSFNMHQVLDFLNPVT